MRIIRVLLTTVALTAPFSTPFWATATEPSRGSNNARAANSGGDHMDRHKKESIKRVIDTAYVEGVHERQDIEAVRAGFHTEFRMMVLDGNRINPVAVDAWLDRVDQLKEGNPDLWSEPTKVEYEMIDIAGRSAVVKLSVFKGTQFFSTDYMLLYQLDDGWTIVSKIFVTEPAR
jgi:hypothetical protein